MANSRIQLLPPLYLNLDSIPPLDGLSELLSELLDTSKKKKYAKVAEKRRDILDLVDPDSWASWYNELNLNPWFGGDVNMLVGFHYFSKYSESDPYAFAFTDEVIWGQFDEIDFSTVFDDGVLRHRWKRIECRTAIFQSDWRSLPNFTLPYSFAHRVVSDPRFRAYRGLTSMRGPLSLDLAEYELQEIVDQAFFEAYDLDDWWQLDGIDEPSDLIDFRGVESSGAWTIDGVLEARIARGTRRKKKEKKWKTIQGISWRWNPSDSALDQLAELFIEKSQSLGESPPTSRKELDGSGFFRKFAAIVEGDIGNDLMNAIEFDRVEMPDPVLVMKGVHDAYERMRVLQVELARQQESLLRREKEDYEAHLEQLSTERGEIPEPYLITSPADAELVARDWMGYWGFDNAKVTQEGADGGIDVIADRAIVQVKAEMKPVGRPVVQQTFGIAKALEKIPVVFALAGFTPEAKAWAAEFDIALFSFDLQGRPQPENECATDIVDNYQGERP